MSRISINKASIDFNITRNTLYKYIKQGKLTKDADGKLDTVDLVRLFGSKQPTHPINQLSEQSYTEDIQRLKQDNEQLKQQILVYEMRVNELKQQLEYVKSNEVWLKQQLDQKLIGHKESKKGFIGKLLGI